jgi:dTDP-4-amino-4,6-dideoxygalactose transaminase
MAAQRKLARGLEALDLAARQVTDLPRACEVPKERRLLRYPLLIGGAGNRDRVYQALRGCGLGPSGMYPSALPAIPGLERVLAGQGPFPEAEAFARRLLTLPTHAGVRPEDVAKMCQHIAAIQKA